MNDLAPVQKVSVQDWMRSKSLTGLMDVLNAKGRALLVGGCVRNMLLGGAVDDIDIATTLTPDEVIQVLSDAGMKYVPTGIDHGTVTAVVDGKGFEVTTLRKDVETDGRHAVVSYTHDWLEDARRRDFTMNTLLCDLDGQVFDPLKQGLEDLNARKVVFVGQAENRIQEDYLRILRFFRFHALYGAGAPDKAALNACEKHAAQISTLSKERITQEFLKILSAEKPAEILKLMFDHKVLSDFDLGAEPLQLLEWVADFQNKFGLGFVASRILVLADLKIDQVERFLGHLILPKVFFKDMKAIVDVLGLPDLGDEHAVKVAVYKCGRVATAQALMIELAQDRVMNGYAPKALDVIQNWDVPDFPVTGEDLIKAGIKPGPQMGERLGHIENWWISEGFKPSRQDCLNLLNA